MAKLSDKGVRTCRARRPDDCFVIRREACVAEPYIVANRQRVLDKILKDDTNGSAQILFLEFTNIDSVDGDPSVKRIIHAAQQFNQRALSRAVVSNERNDFARF